MKKPGGSSGPSIVPEVFKLASDILSIVV